MGTNLMCHVCILVHNIEKTSREWAAFLGVQPPEIGHAEEKAETHTIYLGEPSGASVRMTSFSLGENVDVELIEPDRDPASVWRHDLDTNGEGFHHIAFEVKGMKEKIEICGKQGFTLLQTGTYTGGRYAYLDAREKLKLVLELMEND